MSALSFHCSDSPRSTNDRTSTVVMHTPPLWLAVLVITKRPRRVVDSPRRVVEGTNQIAFSTTRRGGNQWDLNLHDASWRIAYWNPFSTARRGPTNNFSFSTTRRGGIQSDLNLHDAYVSSTTRRGASTTRRGSSTARRPLHARCERSCWPIWS